MQATSKATNDTKARQKIYGFRYYELSHLEICQLSKANITTYLKGNTLIK